MEIGKLRDEEALSFFNRAFEKADIQIEPIIMKNFILPYTGGLPIFMQENRRCDILGRPGRHRGR